MPSLRALTNLKVASTIIVSSITIVALGIAGGVSAPILINMGTDVVMEVKDLAEEYPLFYGKALDLSHAQIHVGNAFDSTGHYVSGDKFTIEGYDPEFIGTQEVTLSYLNFKKKITVTIAAQKLETVEPVFDFNTAVLSWEPVAGAETYSVILQAPVTHDRISTFSTDKVSYDFNGLQFYSQFETYVIAHSDKKGSNGVSAFLDSDPSQVTSLKKISNINNVRYDLAEGKFKWDAVEGVSGYEVHINDTTLKPTVNEIAFDTTAPGVYNLSVRGISNETGTFATATRVDFRRLPTPKLSFADGTISVTDGERLAWYKDGAEFSGDLKTIVDVGTYAISAKNMPASDTEIESAMSTAVNLKKLAAPTLSLSEGNLVTTGVPEGNTTSYFLDGNAWTGNVSTIEETGTHGITAKVVGVGNELDSEVSNSVSVKKLAAPTLGFDNKAFAIDGKDTGFTIYVNDTKTAYTDLDNATLSDTDLFPAGKYLVYAVNAGNGNDEIRSAASNRVNFLVPDITITKGTSGDGSTKAARFTLTHSIPEVTSNVEASISLSWTKSGTEVYHEDSVQTVFANMSQAAPIVRLISRNGADRLTITINQILKLGNIEVLEKTYAPVSVDL